MHFGSAFATTALLASHLHRPPPFALDEGLWGGEDFGEQPGGRDLAPQGADRLYNLARLGYYDASPLAAGRMRAIGAPPGGAGARSMRARAAARAGCRRA